jgi:hypothetical protein
VASTGWRDNGKLCWAREQMGGKAGVALNTRICGLKAARRINQMASSNQNIKIFITA